MAKKEGTENTGATAPETLLLTVKAEHVATPHCVELRRNGGKFVDGVRTQDFASTETIGAMTVENILRLSGTRLPAADEEFIISFSPHTGEVISVAVPVVEEMVTAV